MVKTDNIQKEKMGVTVSQQIKNSKYYAVLQYKDQRGIKKYVWRATKIKVSEGIELAKRKAEEIRQQFELELNK